MSAIPSSPGAPSAGTPRTIGIVAFDGIEIIDLTGPMEVFALTNLYFQRTGLSTEPPYRFIVMAREAGWVTASCGLRIQADQAYTEVREPIDTLIVPGAPDVACVLADRDLMDWVRGMATQVRRLVSVCTGAFLLAETGLLDGRRATSHWAYCERLASDYPSVSVESDRIFIREGQIATSGGITSGIDLALALLEEDWGREAALMAARFMVVFLKRPGGQSQFSGYLSSEATQQPDLRKLQVWIMENPAEDLNLESLAARMAMSPRNFSRVFLAETGLTPAKFVEKARLDAARHYLASTDQRIETTAVVSGFGDAERMRRTFIRHLGINPQEYRARFGRPAEREAAPVVTSSYVADIKAAVNEFDTPSAGG